MQGTPDLIEMAKQLAAWQPESDVAEPRLPFEQIKNTPPEEISRRMADYNAQMFGSVNERIGQFIALFRAASPEERTMARRIIRQGERKPIWRALEQWHPVSTDYAEGIRLYLARAAITWGMTDYRDDTLAMNALAGEVKARGLDWDDLHAEYQKLAADYTPGLIDLPGESLMSEEQAWAEIERLTAAISAGPASAEVFYQRGLVYMGRQDFDHAIRDFSKALELDHGNAEYSYQRGTAYAGAGNLQSAFNDYVNTLTKSPNHPHADEMRDKIREWRNKRNS